MKDLSTILEARQNTKPATTGLNEKYREIDMLFDELGELCNKQFRVWYCGKFFKIGRDRVMILASQARGDGTNPQRLFSHLLAKEK